MWPKRPDRELVSGWIASDLAERVPAPECPHGFAVARSFPTASPEKRIVTLPP